jgi:hypothetical protein
MALFGNKTEDLRKNSRKMYQEVGKSGLKQMYGYPTEEFLTALSGVSGIKTYREMSDNDPIIGGCLFAIKQVLRELRWSASGGSDKDREFLIKNMLSMEHSWSDFIIEVFSMLPYGWCVFEQVYRKSPDGKAMWRKFAFRSQTSLERWAIMDNGETVGMWQRPYPTFDLVYLPFSKCLHFRPDHYAGNPEGRSILRNSYRPWYFKKLIEELEAIGVERDLVGLPVLKMPPGMKVDDEAEGDDVAIEWAKNILTNIRNDEQAGLLLPDGWEFELVSSPGQKQFDTSGIIRRYSVEIAVTVLAQFIMLGMERTGSYALSKNITDMFYYCIEGWADIICSVLNRQAVKLLFSLNGATEDIPQIVHTAVRKEALEKISKYIADLSKANAIDVDEELKTYLKKYARLEDYSEVKN